MTTAGQSCPGRVRALSTFHDSDLRKNQKETSDTTLKSNGSSTPYPREKRHQPRVRGVWVRVPNQNCLSGRDPGAAPAAPTDAPHTLSPLLATLLWERCTDTTPALHINALAAVLIC